MVMDDRFFRNVAETIKNVVGRSVEAPPPFGGKPGEPVPEVDPEDLMVVWQISRDAQASRPGFALGIEGLKLACKPGADVQAIAYRGMMMGMMSRIVAEQLAPFMREGQPNDSVFRAAAKIPVEWMGVGITRHGPPFDVNEFLRLCGEETQTI
jgi:hypothetical protein